jgi:NADH-quinone oxidoreductase subunit B
VGSLVAADEHAESGFFATRAEAFINWGRKNSLWPMPLGLSCCGIELMAMLGPKFDLARFGAEAARFSPRQCDLLIVAGTMTWKMAQAVRVIYDQMPDPKWVMAMGVCSSTGGMYDSYAVVQGVDSILPVDVYVPGCPPRPDAVIDALLKLQKRIEREHPLRRVFGDLSAPADEEGTGHQFRQPNFAGHAGHLDRHPHAPAHMRAELHHDAPEGAPEEREPAAR